MSFYVASFRKGFVARNTRELMTWVHLGSSLFQIASGGQQGSPIPSFLSLLFLLSLYPECGLQSRRGQKSTFTDVRVAQLQPFNSYASWRTRLKKLHAAIHSLLSFPLFCLVSSLPFCTGSATLRVTCCSLQWKERHRSPKKKPTPRDILHTAYTQKKLLQKF